MMRRTRVGSLILVAILTSAAAWAVLRAVASQGVVLPQVPWVTVGVLALISAIVFWLGWMVRQYLQGKRPDLDPIRAARTAVLGKAACYAGALLVGGYGAQVLYAVVDLNSSVSGDFAWSAALAAGGSVVLAATGLLVEWFCHVPPPDGEDHSTDPAPGAATS